MKYALAIVLAVAMSAPAFAQDMPQASMVNGKALPAPELPPGTVTVRVARESIGNWLPGQKVQLVIAGKTVSATTDDAGRAEFKNLTQDAELRAEATVQGEKLVSDSFRVPGQGGLRIILIAGIAQAQERREQEKARERAAPAVKGVVTLGGDTRIIGEFSNDSLFLFYQLDIVNNARAPVDIGGPLQIELPPRTAGSQLMEGSPKDATISGRHVVVPGPFPPGTTTVNVQFQLLYTGSAVTVAQQWPIAVQQLPVFIERVGQLQFSSPSLRADGTRTGQNGNTFIAASGANLPAGSEVQIQLTGLPAHSPVAAYTAVGVASLIIVIGVWLSVTASRGAAARTALIAQRDALLARLEDLELKRRAGKMADERYLSRRQRMMSELEDVYHELDEAGRPRGGDEGVAA